MKTHYLNKTLFLFAFFMQPFAACQELAHVFEHEEVTLHDPQEANKYYFSLLPTTITTIILTLYDKEIRQSYKPEWSLHFKIDKLLKANKMSDAAFWGSFNITTYENSLFSQGFGEGNLFCARLFLKRGKHPSYSRCEYNCSSPLGLALFAKRSAVACMLLEAGADPDYKANDHEGYPMGKAAQNNLPDCIRMLLAKGASKDLDEALQWGAHNNSNEIVALLLTAGVDPDATSAVKRSGHTPIRHAIQHHNSAMAQLLLGYGAKINPTEWWCRWYLSDARTRQNHALVAILEGAGVTSS